MGSPTNSRAPAFPTVDANRAEDYGTYGMTLRDYFAAKAMASLIATDHHFNIEHSATIKATAELAYDYADAMLKAREAA